MSHMWIAIDCFCHPPKRLVSDMDEQSARCDVCGTEIVLGDSNVPYPRLRLVGKHDQTEE